MHVGHEPVNAKPEHPPEFYIPATLSLSEQKPRTLKHGDTFALFNHYGDLAARPGDPEGLYHEDVRFLSLLRLTIDGQPPLLLSSTVRSNNAVLDVDLTNPDLSEGGALITPKDTIHVARMQFLWNATCYEMLWVRNFAAEARRVRLAFDLDADFADVFEVRGHPRKRRGRVVARVVSPDALQFEYASLDRRQRSTELYFEPPPALLQERRAVFELELQPKQRCSVFLTVHCRTENAPVERRVFVALRAARRALRQGSRGTGTIETSNTIANEVLCRSAADISMLVTDTEHGRYPYAGVPWFSTAFGRDGLLTALELLWLDPSLARGVLRFLAANQATQIDAFSDAEPGKILHEARKCELARLGEVPFEQYYGSIDSTPLFVALAGLYWKRTADRATLQTIWPSIQAALTWIDRYGDSDGDGFVEYKRHADGGLVNQGWKDSDDAVFHADGRLASPPIALCEVQGYVYVARTLGAQLAQDMGDAVLATRLREQARMLREQFAARFWDEELGSYVLALDGAKQPCRVRSSNAGQLLLSGIASAEHAERITKQLMSRQFFSGWGIRTIGTREPRFNPASYHNGSVWPHDNALLALGFSRYGHSAQVMQLTTALFEAAAHMDLRRLPELFCGSPRRRDKGPTLYPIACTPQAWAAATPFALLQACIGIEIDAVERRLHLRYPRLPAFLDWVRIRNLTVADASVDLLLRRHADDVAVNILERKGEAEVLVTL